MRLWTASVRASPLKSQAHLFNSNQNIKSYWYMKTATYWKSPSCLITTNAWHKIEKGKKKKDLRVWLDKYLGVYSLNAGSWGSTVQRFKRKLKKKSAKVLICRCLALSSFRYQMFWKRFVLSGKPCHNPHSTVGFLFIYWKQGQQLCSDLHSLISAPPPELLKHHTGNSKNPDRATAPAFAQGSSLLLHPSVRQSEVQEVIWTLHLCTQRSQQPLRCQGKHYAVNVTDGKRGMRVAWAQLETVFVVFKSLS